MRFFGALLLGVLEVVWLFRGIDAGFRWLETLKLGAVGDLVEVVVGAGVTLVPPHFAAQLVARRHGTLTRVVVFSVTAALLWWALAVVKVEEPLPIALILGAFTLLAVALIVLEGDTLARFTCAACQKKKRAIFGNPQPCPGPVTGERRHKTPQLVCAACARQSPLCLSCARDFGCPEPTCRRDLSLGDHCPGPINEPSQCIGPRGLNNIGVKLCPEHHAQRCPACTDLHDKIVGERGTVDAPACPYCKLSPFAVFRGKNLGPLLKCYEPGCNAFGHLICMEGSDGEMLCPQNTCRLHRFRVPKPWEYYQPGGTVLQPAPMK